MASDGSRLLRLDALSVQTASEGCRPIVWMIIGMIKAHPTEHRMPRRWPSALSLRPRRSSLAAPPQFVVAKRAHANSVLDHEVRQSPTRRRARPGWHTGDVVPRILFES